MHVVRNALPAAQTRGVSSAALNVLNALTPEPRDPSALQTDSLLADAFGVQQVRTFGAMPKYANGSMHAGVKKKIREYAETLAKSTPNDNLRNALKQVKKDGATPKVDHNWTARVAPKLEQPSKTRKARVEGWKDEDWGVDSESPGLRFVRAIPNLLCDQN